MKGFTLAEILIVIGILVILAALAVPAFNVFLKESDLNRSSEEIAGLLRLAQSRTISSEGGSQWGVYFTDSPDPDQYILFKGMSYALRDVSFDEVYSFSENIEISAIVFGGGQEVVFNRFTGSTNQPGSLSFSLKSDASKTRTVYVESSGLVEIISFLVPTDNDRIKDSRHVVFDYSRAIAVNTESLTLNFDDTFFETIPLADCFEDSQIYCEIEFDAGGEFQKIKIHTTRLNSPDSRFSIHRDMRQNSKSLKIGLDDAPDLEPGNLIEYSTDGLTTITTSGFAGPITWQ
ncbi:MAG: prepilin-type N-terminal cleavage/methylation domain-containing protein [Candidatus Portnoybacteria bacterium]